VKIRLTDAGCDPASAEVPAGAVTFSVENAGTTKVTEMELLKADGSIMGEAENVVEGVPGSFSLTLGPGRYTLSCPNGSSAAEGVLRVTGKATATTGDAALLTTATAEYREYVEHETDELVEGTRELAAAVEAGDVKRAKALYGPVRAHYEAIEPVAESFGDLDPKIDARVNDVASGTRWTGFHRIEHSLWVRRTTDGAAPYARTLLADVIALRERAEGLEVQPAQLANGAVELLNEVASSKITGEEDRYSHTDLSDFAANLAGARVAFDLLKPALAKQGDEELAETITHRFDDVRAALDTYRRSTPLGYALYGELTGADRRRLAQSVDALAEPLSTVAVKVTG
jgi:iron uptake system component EfeO